MSTVKRQIGPARPPRVGVWVPSELLAAGEIVEVLGPDANGVLSTQGEPLGRVVPVPLDDGEHYAPGTHNGPAGMGPAGQETRAMLALSRALPTGMHQFGIRVRDRRTGEVAAGTSPIVRAFVNAQPDAVLGVRPVEDPVGGKLRFTFATQGAA